MNFPTPQRIKAGDVTLSVHLAGPEDGRPLLLVHGWPELAYSWKNQIGPLAEAGYRVIAPDLKGFGGSDRPKDVSQYAVDPMMADFANLLDALGHEEAVFVGHDWGGILVWHAAMLIPERVSGVIGVNTPHLPRGAEPPSHYFHETGGDDHYIMRFQDKGYAESRFEGREDDFFAFVFGKPPTPEAFAKSFPQATWLPKRFEDFTGRSEDKIVVPPEHRKVYADAYRQTGFETTINLYRNFDANWERMGGVDHRLKMPCMLVAAECDFMLPPELAKFMPVLCPDHEIHVLPECGHWTMWERPDELNAYMLDWLKRRFPA